MIPNSMPSDRDIRLPNLQRVYRPCAVNILIYPVLPLIMPLVSHTHSLFLLRCHVTDSISPRSRSENEAASTNSKGKREALQQEPGGVLSFLASPRPHPVHVLLYLILLPAYYFRPEIDHILHQFSEINLLLLTLSLVIASDSYR